MPEVICPKKALLVLLSVFPDVCCNHVSITGDQALTDLGSHFEWFSSNPQGLTRCQFNFQKFIDLIVHQKIETKTYWVIIEDCCNLVTFS